MAIGSLMIVGLIVIGIWWLMKDDHGKPRRPTMTESQLQEEVRKEVHRLMNSRGPEQMRKYLVFRHQVGVWVPPELMHISNPFGQATGGGTYSINLNGSLNYDPDQVYPQGPPPVGFVKNPERNY